MKPRNKKQRGRPRENEFENLRKSLRTEEEVIAESYNNRLAIILTNTKDNFEQQRDLKARLDSEFATQALGDFSEPDNFEEQLNRINEFYDARKQLILDNVGLTEQARTDLEKELTAQRNEQIKNLEDQRQSLIYNASSQLFGNLAGLARQFAGEQSGLYRTLFAASKAFAIAESVIKIQQGIADAAATGPFPANLAAISTVVAATSSIISTIANTNYNRGGVQHRWANT